MGEVIAYTTSQLTDDDLWAIAAYLKDQPAAAPAAPQPVAAGDPTMKLGQAIYVDACATCHTMAGTGIARLFPALKGMPAVQQTDPASLIRVVLQGTRAVATDAAPTGPAMPAFGWKLSDDQAAAVLTYIRNAWGNAAATVSAGSVASARKNLSEGSE
jgi:mono/diheme cytochrome c family protein